MMLQALPIADLLPKSIEQLAEGFQAELPDTSKLGSQGHQEDNCEQVEAA